jgi:hypothetical protein
LSPVEWSIIYHWNWNTFQSKRSVINNCQEISAKAEVIPDKHKTALLITQFMIFALCAFPPCRYLFRSWFWNILQYMEGWMCVYGVVIAWLEVTVHWQHGV